MYHKNGQAFLELRLLGQVNLTSHLARPKQQNMIKINKKDELSIVIIRYHHHPHHPHPHHHHHHAVIINIRISFQYDYYMNYYYHFHMVTITNNLLCCYLNFIDINVLVLLFHFF